MVVRGFSKHISHSLYSSRTLSTDENVGHGRATSTDETVVVVIGESFLENEAIAHRSCFLSFSSCLRNRIDGY